jgi:hypothetical protein
MPFMSAGEILYLADNANIPSHSDGSDENTDTDLTFDAPNGFKLVCFYDGDEFDYISKVIFPDGEIYEPDGKEWEKIMYWRPNNG